MIGTGREFWQRVGRNVAWYRKHAGLTQADLAGLMGYVRPSITNLETGRQRVPTEALFKIAKLVHVHPFALFEGCIEGEPERPISQPKKDDFYTAYMAGK